MRSLVSSNYFCLSTLKKSTRQENEAEVNIIPTEKQWTTYKTHLRWNTCRCIELMFIFWGANIWYSRRNVDYYFSTTSRVYRGIFGKTDASSHHWTFQLNRMTLLHNTRCSPFPVASQQLWKHSWNELVSRAVCWHISNQNQHGFAFPNFSYILKIYFTCLL